jgi:hypothetical protein
MEVLHYLDHIQLRLHSYWYFYPHLDQDNTNGVAVYLFYPETAGRSLEDIDRFFAGHAPLLVFKDKEAVAEKRPQQYIEREQQEMRRQSSVVAGHAAAATEDQEKSQRDEFLDEA